MQAYMSIYEYIHAYIYILYKHISIYHIILYYINTYNIYYLDNILPHYAMLPKPLPTTLPTTSPCMHLQLFLIMAALISTGRGYLLEQATYQWLHH